MPFFKLDTLIYNNCYFVSFINKGVHLILLMILPQQTMTLYYALFQVRKLAFLYGLHLNTSTPIVIYSLTFCHC